MNDCLKAYLLHDSPFWSLYLALAFFVGGFRGMEFGLLVIVALLCMVWEYRIFKRYYWRGDF